MNSADAQEDFGVSPRLLAFVSQAVSLSKPPFRHACSSSLSARGAGPDWRPYALGPSISGAGLGSCLSGAFQIATPEPQHCWGSLPHLSTVRARSAWLQSGATYLLVSEVFEHTSPS
jgi:hypothetical protein